MQHVRCVLMRLSWIVRQQRNVVNGALKETGHVTRLKLAVRVALQAVSRLQTDLFTLR